MVTRTGLSTMGTWIRRSFSAGHLILNCFPAAVLLVSQRSMLPAEQGEKAWFCNSSVTPSRVFMMPSAACADACGTGLGWEQGKEMATEGCAGGGAAREAGKHTTGAAELCRAGTVCSPAASSSPCLKDTSRLAPPPVLWGLCLPRAADEPGGWLQFPRALQSS